MNSEITVTGADYFDTFLKEREWFLSNAVGGYTVIETVIRQVLFSFLSEKLAHHESSFPQRSPDQLSSVHKWQTL